LRRTIETGIWPLRESAAAFSIAAFQKSLDFGGG